MLFGVEMPIDVMFGLIPLFGLPEMLIEESGGDEIVSRDLDVALHTLAGFAADPDENEMSAETTLKMTDKETFSNIRAYVRVAQWMLRMVPAAVSVVSSPTRDGEVTLHDAFGNVANMLCDPSYRLLLFVLMVRRAQFKGDHGRGIGTFSRAVLTPLRELISFIASNRETQALLHEATTRLGIDQQAPLASGLRTLFLEQKDAALRAIARKLIRIAWRHGLSDLLKLRKPTRSH